MLSAATNMRLSEHTAASGSPAAARPASVAAACASSTLTSMSAHLCFTAWKEPIGRPNCCRSRA